MVLLILITGALVFIGASFVQDNVESLYHDRVVPLTELTDIAQISENTRVQMVTSVLNEDAAPTERAEENLGHIQEVMAGYSAQMTNEEERVLFETFEANWQDFEAIVQNNIALIRSGDFSANLYEESQQAYDAMIGKLKAIIPELIKSSEQVAATSEELMASAEESRSASEEITVSIVEVSEGSQEQTRAVDAAKAAAEESGQSAQQIQNKISLNRRNRHPEYRSCRTDEPPRPACGESAEQNGRSFQNPLKRLTFRKNDFFYHFHSTKCSLLCYNGAINRRFFRLNKTVHAQTECPATRKVTCQREG